MTGKERVQAVIKGESTDCLPLMPITMMFAADQAGVQYGDYAASYLTLVEAQLVTAERFDFDFVSCISDPAREAADCGAKVQYFENQPPAIDEAQALLLEKKRLVGLKQPDPLGGGRMTDRIQAAGLLHDKVGQELLIEGWIEGPCAEAADLRGINNLMLDFMDDPAFVRDLFEFVFEMEMRFAREQIRAGVDIIGIGDAAASLVGPTIYQEFVWEYEKRMVDTIHAMRAMVRLHICGNTRKILKGMGDLGCEIVDLDFLSPLTEARQQMGEDQVLLGNIEPVGVLRNGTPEQVVEKLRECQQMAGKKWIVSAGCEVPRDTPIENIKAMTRYARSHGL